MSTQPDAISAFLDDIASRVVAKLRASDKSKPPAAVVQPELLSRAEAAVYLNISESQLDKLTREGDLKVTRIDSKPRYAVPMLRKFIERRTE